MRSSLWAFSRKLQQRGKGARTSRPFCCKKRGAWCGWSTPSGACIRRIFSHFHPEQGVSPTKDLLFASFGYTAGEQQSPRLRCSARNDSLKNAENCTPEDVL